MLKWNIYEITSKDNMQGVMFRGRIRKFGLLNNINVLTENDKYENIVRFAVLTGQDEKPIIDFIKKLFPSAEVTLVKENVINPVLSKLRVNLEERYNIGE